MKRTWLPLLALVFAASPAPASTTEIVPNDGSSIQRALDAHPGQPVHLPPGLYLIDAPLVISSADSGLIGQGTVIQTNDDADILQIRDATRVQIEGITLKRSQPKLGKDQRAIRAQRADHLVLRNISVLGNRAAQAAVEIRESDYVTVESCSVVDFKTVAVDNRMTNDLYRYAFNAINGHGIWIVGCRGARIIRNRVIETELLPTREVMEKYELGQVVERADELGELASYGVSADGFVFIWHQGGGILVNDATRTAFTLLDGNYIENAAQGMDLHGDFMIVTNNHVTNCYMGMKAFHGARGVIISNNVFHKPGKYGILLRPGSESWEAGSTGRHGEVRDENVERGIIIAHNLITDQGYDQESWRLWNADPSETSPVGIKIGTGPLESNPRLIDLIIEGNMIYDRGRDLVLENDHAVRPPPRYKWAIWFDDAWRAENVRMANNIFHPGEEGVSNLPVTP
ncbi:MAG: right-handed parallel beta-helix repeat-containing protein [Opitutaceae bacterium]